MFFAIFLIINRINNSYFELTYDWQIKEYYHGKENYYQADT